MAIRPEDIRSKIQIPAGITPIDSNSQFPSHYSDFGFGGLRSVATITERNAIPALRRIEGMMVYVLDGDTYFRLMGGITDADWVQFAAGTSEATGLLEIPFEASDWAEPTPADGTTRLLITHDLETSNLNTKWYQTGINGDVDVPWQSSGINQVEACIPAGSEFAGEVRITAFIPTGGTSQFLQGYHESFNGQTTGIGASWVETGTGTGIYRLIIMHGLGTINIDYNFFIDNSCPNLICATSKTSSDLTLELPLANVFGGEVFITRIT